MLESFLVDSVLLDAKPNEGSALVLFVCCVGVLMVPNVFSAGFANWNKLELSEAGLLAGVLAGVLSPNFPN